MKLDPLTSTTGQPAQKAELSALGESGVPLRRVGEVVRASPDPRQTPSPAMATSGTPVAAGAAQRVRELALRLIRLGPQARRLLKARSGQRGFPIDEQV